MTRILVSGCRVARRGRFIILLGHFSFPPHPLDQDDNDAAVDSDSDDDVGAVIVGESDYDYLLGMALWSLTLERKEELLRRKEDKHQELRRLRATTREDMWRADLDEFAARLDEVEEKEREDQLAVASASASSSSASASGAGARGKGGKKSSKKPNQGQVHADAMPSPAGIRVEPRSGSQAGTQQALNYQVLL